MNPFLKVILLSIFIGWITAWAFKNCRFLLKFIYFFLISCFVLFVLSAIEGDFSIFVDPYDWLAWRIVFIVIMVTISLSTHSSVRAFIEMRTTSIPKEKDQV